MSFDIPVQDFFGEVGRIELSHAIETLLGNDNKENDDDPLTRHTDTDPYLESSSINKTPHDGILDRSSARQHCRRLETPKDATPKKRRESRRHLNSVNILCRSKRRKLAERQAAATTALGMSAAEGIGGLSELPLRKYRHLKTLQESNVQLVNRGKGSANDSGIMVKDSLGKLHAAEFVPIMVEERNGGFYVADGDEGTSSQEKTAAAAQDESLTNITWLKRMSAPDVESTDSAPLPLSDADCERPPYSYSALIQFALISTNVGKMTLKEIYDWIQGNFPFFKTAKLGWKNSIRHNLSLHKIFIREPPDGPGKPAYWTLRPGTVVRLPENRLFVMESMGHGKERSKRPKACIKQADGTTQLITENHVPPPPKLKPILPRVTQGYTLLTMPMPMVSGFSPDSRPPRQRLQKGRYPKIAPKQPPLGQPVSWYLPSTSSEVLVDSGINVGSFETPKRKASRSKPEPSSKAGPLELNPEEEEATSNKGGLPIMSTPLKQSTPGGIMESMGSLTPFRDDEDDFALLRHGEDLSNITPIRGTGMTPLRGTGMTPLRGTGTTPLRGTEMTPVRGTGTTPLRGTGMTPIVREFLSNTDDPLVTPVRRPGRTRPSPVSTPVIVDHSELSFDLEDLFGNVESITDDSPEHYSFGHLFSPVSRN